MPNLVSVLGKTFNHLTVQQYDPPHLTSYVRCLCVCGLVKTYRTWHVTHGKIRSCGCKVNRKTSHGESKSGRTPEYDAWRSMLQRCRNTNSQSYSEYGGRGIKVCERWYSFENFLADMGRRPSSKHSLDRYPNNDGNYEPGNCRWATKKEQGANRRDTNLVTIDGVTRCFKDWASIYGIHYNTAHRRLMLGEDPISCLTRSVNTNFARVKRK